MINDYNIVNSSEATERYLEIVRLLQAENPLDVIAVQAHAFTTTVESAVIKENVDRLAPTWAVHRRQMPREHLLVVDTFVPRPREETFAFFAAAENLERITPPELRFEITTAPPIEMAEGARIEYRLGLFGLPFSWTTLISQWVPGERFVDEQLRGPYAKWVHSHTFSDAPGGTKVRDEVRYRLPFYPFGEVGHPLVRRQLHRIFEYRGVRLRELLSPGPA